MEPSTQLDAAGLIDERKARRDAAKTAHEMAKFKAKISKEEHAKLTEAERANYVPVQGTDIYVFDLEPVDGFAVEDIRGLLATKDSLRAEKAALEKQLKDGGPSAAVSAELADVKAQLEALKKSDPEGKKKAAVEETERVWRQKSDAEKAEWTAKESKYLREINNRVRRADLATALAEKKARPERLDKLVTLNESRLKVMQREDGSFYTQVVDGEGKPAYSNRTGQRSAMMTLDEVAEEAMKEMPEFFQGHQAGGSGAGHATQSGGSGQFSMRKSDALNSPKTYDVMKAKAQAAGQEVTLTAD